MSAPEPHNPTPDFTPQASPPPGVPAEAGAPPVHAPAVPAHMGEPAAFVVEPTAFAGEPTDQILPQAAVEPGHEQVGRGLLFSLGSILVGIALTLLLWQLGFIASITSFALAYAAIWLYTKGAGAPPAKGALGVVTVIVIGVALSLLSVVVADALSYLGQEYPDASIAEKFDFVTYNLGRAELWQEYTTDALMYLLFAALGTFGLIRQLGRAKGA